MGVGGVMQLVFPQFSLWTFNYILSAKSSKKRLPAHSTRRWTTVSFTRIARWTHSECGYTRSKPPLTVSVYKYMVMKMLFWEISYVEQQPYLPCCICFVFYLKRLALTVWDILVWRCRPIGQRFLRLGTLHIYIYIYIYIQSVPGGMDKTSGECSLG